MMGKSRSVVKNLVTPLKLDFGKMLIFDNAII